jgi:hypothetical protein
VSLPVRPLDPGELPAARDLGRPAFGAAPGPTAQLLDHF